MSAEREMLAGWGGQPVPGRERLSEDLAAITAGAVLTRGLGRAYGDAALPPTGVREVAGSRLADRILAFDAERGIVRSEAGLALRELHRVLGPRGFFTPVSPGTAYVTLGGMVAADVHGKNHHVASSFGRHVTELLLRTGTGALVRCSRESEPELFRATLGGMGLTGHLLEVEHRLERIPSSWIRCESRRFARLDELVTALREASREWPFTVAWLDCLRREPRGVLHCGRWCEAEEAPAREARAGRAFTVPFQAPSLLLNRASMRAFNQLVYLRQRTGGYLVHSTPFFYPLDRLRRWPRLYGRRGLTQHQCVLPDAGPAELARFLGAVRAAGGAPFLAVLKDFGAEGEGVLSFPRPGLTLALDFAVDHGTPALVAALNREVRAMGGRIYLAKDAFTTAEDFAAMEGERLERFQRVRERWDPEGRLGSRLSRRLIDVRVRDMAVRG